MQCTFSVTYKFGGIVALIIHCYHLCRKKIILVYEFLCYDVCLVRSIFYMFIDLRSIISILVNCDALIVCDNYLMIVMLNEWNLPHRFSVRWRPEQPAQNSVLEWDLKTACYHHRKMLDFLHVSKCTDPGLWHMMITRYRSMFDVKHAG